jgi:hypothetical protein
MGIETFVNGHVFDGNTGICARCGMEEVEEENQGARARRPNRRHWLTDRVPATRLNERGRCADAHAITPPLSRRASFSMNDLVPQKAAYI